MGRWGGEETKSQGVFGCAIAGLILLAVGFVAFKAYPSISKRAEFEKSINKILRGSRRKSLAEIENSIMESSKKIGLPLLRDDIELTKGKKGKDTPVIEAYIPIKVEIDFGWGPREFSLPPIVAEVTLIQF